MENSPVKSISDQTWKTFNIFEAFNLESYCSLIGVFLLVWTYFFIVGGWVIKVSRFDMNKTHIHICTGRLCVHKRSNTNLSGPDISKARLLGEIYLLPGLHMCLCAKKPEYRFQNAWMHYKRVPKQMLHAC